MSKFFQINVFAIIFLISLLSGCNGKSENFEIDLSNFKVTKKNKVKISKPEISSSAKTKNKLKSYQNKSEILSSVIFGKIDPFSKEGSKVRNFTSDLKLTGFASTKINKYVFVSYLGRAGTISTDSIGGVNTFLLPKGAKVINIDPKKMKLIINFENEDYIFEL